MARRQQTVSAQWLARLVAYLLAALMAAPASSQSGGGVTLSQPTVAGGGGTSTNGQTRLDGTVGQHAAVESTDGTFTLASGFWPAALSLTPTLSINDIAAGEGNLGTSDFVFTVTVSPVSTQPISVTYSTSDGTANAPSDYAAIPPTVVNIPAGASTANITVKINGDITVEPDETFTVGLSNPMGAVLGKAVGTGTILNDDTAAASFSFGQTNYSVHEACTSVAMTVIRTGDASTAASVDYSTSDGTASERSDYTTALGTLRFAPGETQKQLTVLVSDDSFVEGNETFSVALSNPSIGFVLGSPSVATVTIVDDASEPTMNVIDDPTIFVAQHYHDFLNREPDPDGLKFWTNTITSCGVDAQCTQVKRINMSAAFFLSIEFQQTGYFVYKTYKAAFGNLANKPIPVARLAFLSDTQRIAGTPAQVIVGQGDWQTQLDTNKTAYAQGFVQRLDFLAKYPSGMAATTYVDTLFSTARVTPTAVERGNAVTAYGTGDVGGRAAALRAVVEGNTLQQSEFNKAFVLMQYFGYLRRNPDEAADTDFSGYNFWLSKLDQFGGDFIQAEMVKAFIESTEYRKRFGQP
jgi:Calx-beta domain-containing protein